MEFVNGKDDIPYMKWKIKVMFQTTDQSLYYTEHLSYEFVSWDDDIPNIDGTIKFHGSSHHQPENYTLMIPEAKRPHNSRLPKPIQASSCACVGG